MDLSKNMATLDLWAVLVNRGIDTDPAHEERASGYGSR
jgi:hypothetical protein